MSGSFPVLVDDADPEIVFTSLENLLQTRTGNGYGQTTTSMLSTGFFFSYHFNGSQVAVFPAYSQPLMHQVEWECAVDQKIIPSNNVSSGFPLQSLCEIDGLDSGTHTISVHVKSMAGREVLTLDYIKYLPSDALPTSPNLTVFIESTEEVFSTVLGPEWSTLGNTTATFTMGSNNSDILSLSFEGTDLEWYGLSTSAISQALLPSNIKLGRNVLNYTIDIGSNQPLAGSTEFGTPELALGYNRLLFRTPQLDQGKHNLTVSFSKSSISGTPLTLDYLVVHTNLSASFRNGGSPTSTSVNSSPSVYPRPGTHQNVARDTAVIAATLLVSVACLLGFVTYILLRRRNQESSAHNLVTPFRSTITFDSRTGGEKGMQGSETDNSRGAPGNFNTAWGKFEQRQRRIGYLPPINISRIASRRISPYRLDASSGGPSEVQNPRTEETYPPPPDFRVSRSSGSLVGAVLPATIVRHEDSGMRLCQSETVVEVLELPPAYTLH